MVIESNLVVGITSAFITFVVVIMTLSAKDRMTCITKGLLSLVVNDIYGKLRSSTVLQAITRYSQGKAKAPKGLPHLVDFEKVSSRAFRVLGQNPGQHTLQGTNTWLITGLEGNTEHILIDTGEDHSADDYVSLLFNEIFPLTGTTRLSKILLTHGHGDHQGGVKRILEELNARNMLPLPTIHKRDVPNGSFPVVGFPSENICDQDEFKVGSDTTLQAVYTPGHTDDHVSFLLHEDNALLSGDCVLGCGTTVFDNLYEYMQSLQRIRKIVVDSQAKAVKHKIHNIYPGHGPVIRDTALAKIDEYIHHRHLRETQIVQFLARSVPKTDPATGTPTHALHSVHGDYQPSWDIMHSMYHDLSWVLKISAMHNVAHHLQKLQQEGKVETKWPDQWRLVVQEHELQVQQQKHKHKHKQTPTH